MPAVFACPIQTEAPVAQFACPIQTDAPVAQNTSSDHAKLEGTVSSHDVALSFAGSVPEMYRRTLTAMISGQKVSSMIPLPLTDCCSKQAIDASTEISKAGESEETVEEEILNKIHEEAEDTHPE